MDWNMPPHRPKGGKDFGELEQLLEQLRNRLGFRFPAGKPVWIVVLVVLALVSWCEFLLQRGSRANSYRPTIW